MLTNGQPRSSLRNVRNVVDVTRQAVNNQASLLNQTHSNTVYLKNQVDTLKQRVDGLTERLDAHLSMGFKARFLFLFRGR